MPDRPLSSKDLAATLNNVTERLRAVERLLSMTSEQRDQLLLQTFEDGNPLGDTLSINFGAGLDAVLTGPRAIEVSGLKFSHARLIREDGEGDPSQTVPHNTTTILTFPRARLFNTEQDVSSTSAIEDEFFSWDVGTPDSLFLNKRRSYAAFFLARFTFAAPSLATQTRFALILKITPSGGAEADTSTLNIVLTKSNQTLQASQLFPESEGARLRVSLFQNSGADAFVEDAQLFVSVWD